MLQHFKSNIDFAIRFNINKSYIKIKLIKILNNY